MSCELIKLNFKTGKVISRRTLEGREKYNALQDPDFKFFTGEFAGLVNAAAEEGVDPRRLVSIVTDDTAGCDMLMFDERYITRQEVIASLRRLLQKLKRQQPDPGAV